MYTIVIFGANDVSSRPSEHNRPPKLVTMRQPNRSDNFPTIGPKKPLAAIANEPASAESRVENKNDYYTVNDSYTVKRLYKKYEL